MATKIRRTYRCPDCAEKFSLAHGDPIPNYCPLCGAYVGVDPNFVPSRMNIATSIGKAGDWSYRKLEADSEARAEAAVPAIEQQLRDAGIPAEQAQKMAAAQAAEIKVTNMRDNMREGDVAAIPQVSPLYRQQVTALGGDPNGAFVGGMGVASASPAPVGESGAKAVQMIQGGVWRSRTPTASATVLGMRGGFGKVG